MSAEQWRGVFSITNETPGAYGEIEMFSYIHDGTEAAKAALERYIKSEGQARVGTFHDAQYPGDLPFSDEVRAFRVGFGATDKEAGIQRIDLSGFLQVDHSEAA